MHEVELRTCPTQPPPTVPSVPLLPSKVSHILQDTVIRRRCSDHSAVDASHVLSVGGRLDHTLRWVDSDDDDDADDDDDYGQLWFARHTELIVLHGADGPTRLTAISDRLPRKCSDCSYKSIAVDRRQSKQRTRARLELA